MVASLALFLSLGGVSYGLATGSIDGREIRNNTIRGSDIRNAHDLQPRPRQLRAAGAQVRAGRDRARRPGDAGHLRVVHVVGQCQAAGANNTRFRAVIAGTEAGSAFGSTENTSGSLSAATPEAGADHPPARAGPAATNHTDSAADGFSATAPSGHSFSGNVHAVVNGQSKNCRAYGDYTRIK